MYLCPYVSLVYSMRSWLHSSRQDYDIDRWGQILHMHSKPFCIDDQMLLMDICIMDILFSETWFAQPVMTYRWWRYLHVHSSSKDAIFNGRGKYNIFGPFARYFERIQTARRQNLLVTARDYRSSLESRLLVRIWTFLICHVEVSQTLVALNNPALRTTCRWSRSG